MSLSTPFIHRPVGTSLLTLAVALAGGLAYFFLPVSPLPQVDFPTINVSASLPGASPQTMASAVATPLERQFGRIASVTEMTSSSSLGSTNITLQFDLNRDIDAAGRDVQAAINAARGNLPSDLPGNPTYRKVNPADAPILILAITSDQYTRGQMYDAASSILAQKLSQVPGVGTINVGGSALPAVRVEVNPATLNARGLGLEDLRQTLSTANANSPKGEVAGRTHTWQLGATDQIFTPDDYKPLVIAYRDGAPVRVEDVAQVIDSVEDVHNGGQANGKPAVLLIISRQPGANIIQTVDRVLAEIPTLRAEIPAAMNLQVVMDRTTTIRASVHDVEITLCLSICLVVLVVFVFLRDIRTTAIPFVAVPVSLIGTFGVMYLCGYSIDNLSLMAMTVATGFVVDDAIVVIENITRHLEEGKSPLESSLLGAQEIGFTVLSMSVSLVAVFIPILLMQGIVGRLFREFAVTLSVAIAVSLGVSLTTTPMMCAILLRPKDQQRHGRFYRASEAVFDWFLGIYERSLGWVLRHPLLMLMSLVATVVLTVYLYIIVPKGFFPQQDTGRLMGQVQTDQDLSFQAVSKLLTQYQTIIAADPAVNSVVGFAGSGGARMFISLKDRSVTGMTADQFIQHMRPKLMKVAGAQFLAQSVQDLRIGGRMSAAEYQYTLQGDNTDELLVWAPKLLEAMKKLPGLQEVNSDQQSHGLASNLTIDRATAARLGITDAMIDDTLYDAFGQRQVSTMYKPLNQYHVVMEAAPAFTQTPDGLNYIYVTAKGANGTTHQVPLSAFAHYAPGTTPLSIAHQGTFPATTLSFNLDPGYPLSTAVAEIEDAGRQIGLPASIHGNFSGTAQAFQDSVNSMPWLIAAALATVYIVLGMLYESYIHPITILSTLPSAGVGALVALLVFQTPLDIIGLIGIILLIGIVKKNAIMMIDFALDVERREHLSPRDAIFRASLLRFRPITMTTMAALLGGLPLAIGMGTGSELRRPLGIAIVGGLIFSQMLTLYTTPVAYLYMDRLRLWLKQLFEQFDPKLIGRLVARRPRGRLPRLG